MGRVGVTFQKIPKAQSKLSVEMYMKAVSLLAMAVITVGIYSPVNAQPSTETDEAQTLIEMVIMICP